MPIHFQYNYLKRKEIPLHNEKYSLPDIEKEDLSNMFDTSLDQPSHVILNHVSVTKDPSDEMSIVTMT